SLDHLTCRIGGRGGHRRYEEVEADGAIRGRGSRVHVVSNRRERYERDGCGRNYNRQAMHTRKAEPHPSDVAAHSPRNCCATRKVFANPRPYRFGSFSTVTARPSSAEITRVEVVGSPLVQNRSRPAGLAESRSRSSSTRASWRATAAPVSIRETFGPASSARSGFKKT